MPDEGEKKGTKIFWLVLPFIITSCFVIFMVVIGPKSGEEDSYWYMLLPGMVMCIFPCSKLAAFIIQANLKASAIGLTRERYSSHPELKYLKKKIMKWWIISLLMIIVVFFSEMAGVIILNAGKSRDQSSTGINNQQDISNIFLRRNYREGKAETIAKERPLSFIKHSNFHKRLRFYDNFIYRLIPLPFLGMLIGAVFLIRALIGRWWKWKKIPLCWKIVPFIAIGLFGLPIMLTFAVGERMNTVLRTESLKFLNGVSDKVVVIINGKAVDNPGDVISELLTLASGRSPKSPKEERIIIEIVDSDYSFIFELGRDYWLHTEYWVFYPGYRHTRLNKIGRINTTIFDKY